jgi:hypothetical protein
MNLNLPKLTRHNACFVPCVAGRRMVKPILLRAHRAMSGSKVLISPAVFQSGKNQAGPFRMGVAPARLEQIYLNSIEIYRGKISRRKIKTNLEERTLNSAK